MTEILVAFIARLLMAAIIGAYACSFLVAIAMGVSS